MSLGVAFALSAEQAEELVIQDGPALTHAVFGSVPLMRDEDAATFAGYLSAGEAPAVAASLEQVDQRAAVVFSVDA